VIPGLNGHPGMLLAAARMLFPPDWRVTGFDHHGDLASDGVTGLARRVLASADGEIILCGESFGGTVALTAAYLAPERVKGLILLSTFGWHPSNLARRGQGALALWSFLGGRISDRVYKAVRLASVASQFGVTFFNPELVSNYMQRPRANVEAYRRKAELSLIFDARAWLHEIRCPAFVLVGLWDPVVPPIAGRELARLLPNAELHRLPGGHLVHLVHARRVGQLIARWAARHAS